MNNTKIFLGILLAALLAMTAASAEVVDCGGLWLTDNCGQYDNGVQCVDYFITDADTMKPCEWDDMGPGACVASLADTCDGRVFGALPGIYLKDASGNDLTQIITNGTADDVFIFIDHGEDDYRPVGIVTVGPETAGVIDWSGIGIDGESDVINGKVWLGPDELSFSAQNKYILIPETTGNPYVCDNGDITSLEEVSPGCDGYDADPTYSEIQVTGIDYYKIQTTNSGGGNAGAGETNLTIKDSAEGTTAEVGEWVEFYAYYFNSSANTPLTDSNSYCDVNIEGTNYSMSYVGGDNIWYNLSATDSGDWAGTSIVYSITYDSTNDLIYTGIESGKFGVYNISDNIWYDLSATDSGNWVGSSNVYGVAYDSTNDLVYTGIDSGKFGVYNVSDNIWYDLSATDSGDWAGTSRVYSVAYDSNNDLVYTGLWNGKFGVYNVSDNIWYDLSATDSGDWAGIFDVRAVAYDSNNDLVYTGMESGKFGVYNRTSNVWTNLSATDSGDWAGIFDVRAVAYDLNNDLVYTGQTDGKFGVYNRTSNVWTNLSATDPGDWVGEYIIGSTVLSITYDSTNDLIYTGIESGKFGVYNISDNIWYDLSATDSGNWVSSSNVFSVVHDFTNDLVYTGLSDGKLGRYSPDGRWEYNYTTGYSSSGTKNWQVWCNTTAAGHFNLTATDDVVITEAGGETVPEFSDLGWILAAVLGGGGFILLRRKRSAF